MTKRSCSTSGCGELVEQGVRGGRCDDCESEHNRARGSATARGYGKEHQAERARLQDYMDNAGVQYACWRCLTRGVHKPIDPTNWHLGHCDNNRSIYHGPECPPCNDATAGRLGRPCPHPSHRQPSQHPGG